MDTQGSGALRPCNRARGQILQEVLQPFWSRMGAYLARWGNFHSVGSNFYVNTGCKFLDPSLVRIGNSVGLSDCTLIGHDGVVLLIEHRFGKHLDSVGFIDIKDNCFIGHGAIVMPRVTIGPESIVAAGAVVTRTCRQAPSMVATLRSSFVPPSS